MLSEFVFNRVSEVSVFHFLYHDRRNSRMRGKELLGVVNLQHY